MNPRHQARPIRTFVLLLIAAVIGCTSGGPESPQAADSPAPETSATAPAAAPTETGAASATAPVLVSPRPGTPAVDPTTARRLEAEGELTAAVDAYLSLTLPGGPNRTEGVLGAARVLLELERPADARALLEPFVQSTPGTEAAPARYLLGRAYAALKLPDQALAQFDAYVASGRVAAPYAQYDRALALLDLGQPVAAASAAQNGSFAGLPGASRRSFLLLIAQSYEKAGSSSEAIRWYQSLFDASPGDQPLALSKVAAIKRSAGDSSYASDYQRLMAGYPITPQALAALNDLLARGESVDAYVKGLVFYRNNDYTKAEPAFREKIATGPDLAASAESYYYLAAVLESKGLVQDAITNYARAQTLNPASSIADDALWWRGRLLEDDNRLTEAATVYAQLLTSYPNSSWAADAAFRRGMLAYRRGAYSEAASTWSAGRAAVTDPDERDRLGLWQGKALLKAGDRAAAQAVLDPLAREGEDDYYGVRAVGLLKGEHGIPRATADARANLAPAFDWNAAEAWLTQRTGRTVLAAADQAWSRDPRWLRAQELWLVGRASQADAEAFDLIEAYAGDGIAMYTISRQLGAGGRAGMSARAGQRLLRVLNTNPNQGLPRALMSLSYPAAFAASVQRAASAQGISPLLLLAFVRQESFFDPRAASGPGALGLTQVLPATGRTIASRLGVSGFEPEQLLQADLNLRFGTSYMATQLKDFNDSLFAAFAAYNAGPNAARRWASTAPNDGDVFIETVEYSETRLYIRIVAENYAIYRYLYGGSAVPDLPSN